MNRKVKIIPSILGQDLGEINTKLKIISRWHVVPHLDISDGRLVKNISLSQDIFRRIKWPSGSVAHLMVDNPIEWIGILRRAKIKRVIIHIESRRVKATLASYSRSGFMIGLGIFSDTPITRLSRYQNINWFHIMTGVAGFYGSKFNKRSLPRLRAVKKLRPGVNISCDVGINFDNIPDLYRAGANTMVVGSYIWRAKNPNQSWLKLQKFEKSLVCYN